MTFVDSDQPGGATCLQVTVEGESATTTKAYCEPAGFSIQAVADKLLITSYVAVMYDGTVSDVRMIDSAGESLRAEVDDGSGWTVMIAFTGGLVGARVDFKTSDGQARSFSFDEEGQSVIWPVEET